ncbi:hypothetical protein [Pedobacter rhizosphaerae]|uniref:NIPSNAP protein n=1 Tax=Pedobacter rhizosphaerae TaxID=390241 RepID=A0A1H9WAT2_9SPHI|nr:hypothetical protein [Pedobacter rhizosphaerae]SES31052.1 hypothetical protein SAMN04488023_1676 [Pedobacter rhizosphaerae]
MMAVELTTFKLNNCTLAQFIEANQEIDVFLRHQKGFLSRNMFELGGIIYDLLFWNSEAEGRAAMHKLMIDLSDSMVHDMIDQPTVSWNITTVKHFVNS